MKEIINDECSHSQSTDPPERRRAQVGDIVTIDLDLTPENGFVPERLFDTSGRLTFVLGWGNYLPGLHALIIGMSIGEEAQEVSVDGGWGHRSAELVIKVPKTNLKKVKSMDSIQVGSVLNLERGIQVVVIEVTEDSIVVDANHPMAGSSYACSLKLVNIESLPVSKLAYTGKESEDQETPSLYEVATFAMGCFWGGELAFSRTPGVVGTKVGYTHGLTKNPTYEDVCLGDTQHREAIMVIYDPEVVPYQHLTRVFLERLAATTSQYKIELFREEYSSMQYRHGIYYHNKEQRRIAQEVIESNHNFYQVELKKVSRFYDADNYHQQYLLKGGQSARKGAKETIKCFG
jgi:peptide-methionine (S)-S-oxide reductase